MGERQPNITPSFAEPDNFDCREFLRVPLCDLLWSDPDVLGGLEDATGVQAQPHIIAEPGMGEKQPPCTPSSAETGVVEHANLWRKQFRDEEVVYEDDLHVEYLTERGNDLHTTDQVMAEQFKSYQEVDRMIATGAFTVLAEDTTRGRVLEYSA